MRDESSMDGIFQMNDQPYRGPPLQWAGHEFDKGRPQQRGWKHFVDSFRRDPSFAMTPRGVVGANGRVFDPTDAAIATASSPLARQLKGRHLQMIAIGGSIGEYAACSEGLY
jgi:hypothetical protein